MEDPMLASNYPFSGMRGPWFTAPGDDMALVAPADDLSNWNEWMHYDPAAVSQNPDAKLPMSAYPRPAQQQSPVFDPRQQTQAMASNAMATAASLFAQSNGVPFSFGQSVDMPPAFDFSGNASSSPVAADVQQQNGYYSPSMWQQQQQRQQQQQQQQQQQHQQQQQQMGDNTLFSSSRFDQQAFAAPPPAISTPSLHHSPSSLGHGPASSSSAHSSPEPISSSKKRKASSDSDEPDDSTRSGKKERSQPPKKTAHNMIEKRYRNNLNDKIAALRDSVPSLRVMSRPNGTEEEDDPEDLEGLTPAHKLNKATVLSKATEYIRHLEKRNKRLQDEVTALKGRVESYEKLAMSGSMSMHAAVGTPDNARYHKEPYTPTHGMPMSGPPQGMIPVPDNIAALQRGLPPQSHYAPAYPPYSGGTNRSVMPGPPMVNGRRGGAMAGKLMVGALAGLMVFEGMVEHEQSQEEPGGRGLFALPISLHHFLAPQASFGVSTTQIPIVKLLLIFGAFAYLVMPLLDFKAKPKKKAAPAVLLTPAPSLASPVEVRRKAWLTAIQTVWVPQHNFILEAAALGLKTLKLSTRKIIGWEWYAHLTGITKEQEAARVKAWTIALDAQLTGGDAEISWSRLILSLVASGTLPDTPASLMLKALHIRVLLWEIGNAGLSSWWIDHFSAKLAESYWNMARSEHKIAANTASNQDSEAERLPEHLVALLERQCDEVLVPAIVQRAHNLAWNRPSAEKTDVDLSMDGVVEDFDICSPLDALAAWYSSTVLKKGLADYLGSKAESPKEGVISDLELALRSSPPNSQAQVRALVAQAVVFDDDRNARIATALRALPVLPAPQSKDVGFMNLVGDGSVAVDVRKALTLAKCLSFAESSSAQARHPGIFVVNNTYFPEPTITLLSFVAGYRVLTRFMQDATLHAETGSGLERIAASLRTWVGHETGRRSGLSDKARRRIVRSCLDATKVLVGLAERGDEVDDGYVSASAKDD
ncbi:hypothetical protein P153DRAFT_368955 [Dothidotthia symphoricarpi CBS 119687]|uniref:BHLH domain-containing protein n=1 Tax=Dothidotthia symphoricarpi CBS 119687 TaxID=1392245 RepID=A0A6A6A719_9PLEO|nr:uncharacterized protein P153DRAFT_368955 [Dothidotthia symphoricarpi CBS 119687]KAF2126933.1 hypothetical protein P153DRAFT_368955 [Dothidotthia symphoricarpi CBS 119687]